MQATNITIVGNKVIQTLDNNVSRGETLSEQYIPGTNKVQDVQGSVAAAFNQAVTIELWPNGDCTDLLLTVIDYQTIQADWINGSTDETGISIERSLDGVTYAEIIELAAGLETYTNTGLDASTLYYYRVRAVKNGYYSDYTAVESATTDSQYVTEYQAIYEAMTVKPSSGESIAYNAFVAGRVSSGVWQKLDKFLFFGIADNSTNDALINWKNPGVLNAEIGSVTPPTFIPYLGFLGVLASSTWINTKFNPTRDGSNYVRDSAGLGVFVTNNRNPGAYSCLSANQTTTIYTKIDTKLSSPTTSAYYGVNVSGANLATLLNADSFGFYHINRIAASIGAFFRDIIKTAVSIVKTDHNVASVNVFDKEFYALANNNNGTANRFSHDQIGALWFSSGLTDDDVTDLRNGIVELFDYRDNRVNIAGKNNYYFGDSITHGDVTSYLTGMDWPSLLTAETGTIKNNEGVGSMSLLDGSLFIPHSPNFQSIYESEIPVYDAETCGGLFFSFGVVDSISLTYATTLQFTDFYLTVINHAINVKGWPKKNIVINTPSISVTLNTAVVAWCIVNDLNYYNATLYMSEHGGSALLSDGIHPTDEGYQVYLDGLMRDFRKWFIF